VDSEPAIIAVRDKKTTKVTLSLPTVVKINLADSWRVPARSYEPMQSVKLFPISANIVLLGRFIYGSGAVYKHKLIQTLANISGTVQLGQLMLAVAFRLLQLAL
jgi:hypothetical protein